MTISLTIQGDAASVIMEMKTFLELHGAPANIAQPAPAPAPAPQAATPLEAHLETLAPKPQAEVIPPEKPAKGKKAKPEPETIDAKASDVPMLTIEDARERMRQFCKDGHSEAVYGALAEFKADKLSAIDPDSAGKPSPKFAEYVAVIERLIAEAPKVAS